MNLISELNKINPDKFGSEYCKGSGGNSVFFTIEKDNLTIHLQCYFSLYILTVYENKEIIFSNYFRSIKKCIKEIHRLR